jgi:hypothetical protein
MIERIIRGKFIRENIKDVDQKTAVCIEFTENVMDLINAISIDAIDSVEYIQKTFNLKS